MPGRRPQRAHCPDEAQQDHSSPAAPRWRAEGGRQDAMRCGRRSEGTAATAATMLLGPPRAAPQNGESPKADRDLGPASPSGLLRGSPSTMASFTLQMQPVCQPLARALQGGARLHPGLHCALSGALCATATRTSSSPRTRVLHGGELMLYLTPDDAVSRTVLDPRGHSANTVA